MTPSEKPDNPAASGDKRPGVLVVNLGTPDAPTPAALKSYLAEFLWDPKVIKMPRPVWWLLLNVFILQSRPRASAEAYAKVWTDEGSPLLVESRRLTEAIANDPETDANVVLAMRYGNPSIAAGLAQLRDDDIDRLIVLPLFPQFSDTTTGSIIAAVIEELDALNWTPELKFIESYFKDPGYINAVTGSVWDWWSENDRAERLLFSFHGIPKKYSDDGDPYDEQCQETARIAAQTLDLSQEDWAISFQSRFGSSQWLQPYTDVLLEEWARDGVKSVQIICPGFAVDCLETLEEIAIRYRRLFAAAGGETFEYIPALNANVAHVNCLTDLISRFVAVDEDSDAGTAS